MRNLSAYWILLSAFFVAEHSQGQNSNNAQLVFLHQSGFYTSPVYQKISSPTGDEIFYTLDGSLPTEKSILYEDSILLEFKYSTPNYLSEIPTTPEQSVLDFKAWESPQEKIDKANILRSASFKNGAITSKVYTQTFFVDSLIENKYTLPVISLVTEEKNFFSLDSGIYIAGNHFDAENPQWTGNSFERGIEWERPVHIEFFEKDGSLGFSHNAGIRIHGLKTRHASQKSLRMYAREEYGEKFFNYQLMPQKELGNYKRFVLRATMGTWGGQTLIADVLAHELSRDLDIDYQDYQPVVVFLNGEYWGIHTIRDRIDERYIEYTHNIDKDAVIFIEDPDSGFEGILNFIKENDLSKDENYQRVITQIEISNYIDYNIAHMFFKNFDWPGNNVNAWRSNRSNSKWRWIFFDLDAGFIDADYNMIEHATANDPSIDWPNSPNATFLFRNLLKNETFKNQFLSRYAEVLNTYFSPFKMVQTLNTIKAVYEPEILRHIQRWNYPNDFASWETDIRDNLLTFLQDRACNVEAHVREFFNPVEFDFQCVAIIEDVDAEDKLVLAPNPNHGVFFIYNNSGSDIDEGTINMTSVSGSLVYAEDGITLARGEQWFFVLPRLPNNTYILKFRSSELSTSKKVIIEN